MTQRAPSPPSEAAVIAAMYAAIGAPATWPDVLERLGARLGADAGMMVAPAVAGLAPVPLCFFGLDPTPILSTYPRYAGRAEFTVRALATGRCPGAFLLDELIPPQEQAESPYWRDMVAAMGITSGVFLVVRTPDEARRPVVINLFRRGARAPFAPDDVTAAAIFIPHLRRALSVALDGPPAIPAATGYEVGAPCFLLGPDGAILHRNHAATVMLGAQDGVADVGGRIRFQDRNAQRLLDAAIGSIERAAWSVRWRYGTEFLAERATGGAPMVIVMLPLGMENPIATVATQARCAVYILEAPLRANSVVPERARRLFGLTRAETDIALAVAGGATLKEIADTRGVTMATVKAQLRAALAKTGARRQAELSALLNRLRF